MSAAPNLTSLAPLEDPGGRDLFSDLVVSIPHRAPANRALPISLTVHGIIGLLVLLAPLLWSANPEVANSYQVMLFSPPPAAAAPLALGSESAKETKKAPETEPKRETPKPPDPTFTVPRETKPIEPETHVAQLDVQGSAQGTVGGIAEGLVGGVDGGIAGGVLNGVVGGVPGGTGVVTDYDQQPRLIQSARPVYPQDAFVKKIEGTVILEILIDATGRVVNVRVVDSVPALDRAAIECVYKWVFQPALKHGRPVAVMAQAPVAFHIW